MIEVSILVLSVSYNSSLMFVHVLLIVGVQVFMYKFAVNVHVLIDQACYMNESFIFHLGIHLSPENLQKESCSFEIKYFIFLLRIIFFNLTYQ
jgi:hypothetical protein